MIKIEDLNTILKYFAIEIQKRVQEIQRKNRSSRIKNDIMILHHQSKNDEVQLQSKVQQIIMKYQNIEIENLIDVQYVKKMSQRVQQIFGFYKWRCRNQSVLSHAERQLSSKLNILITEHPLNPAKVMAYVVEISRKGFSFNGRHVNQAQKSSLIYSSSSKLQRKFNCSSETKQIAENKTVSSFGFHLHPNNNLVDTSVQRQRTSSVMCQTSGFVNPLVEIIDRLYSCMNIDKVYLSRCIEREKYFARNQTKRNKSALKKFQGMEAMIREQKNSSSSTRKMKTQSRGMGDSKNILSEIRINSKLIGIGSVNEEDHELKRAPMTNITLFGKKWSKIKCAWKKKKEERNSNNQNNII